MYPYSSVVRNRTREEYGYIYLVCSWLHWSPDKFVLCIIDYTGVRIQLSCLFLITLESWYICLVYHWLHWSTDTFILWCSHVQNMINVSVLQCSQEQYRTKVSLLQCSQEQTRQIYPYSSVVRNRTKQMYPVSSVIMYRTRVRDYTGYGYNCIVCYWLHWSTDTFVLYVTDYTGVRIYLSCMLLTTLEHGYMCLVLFVTTLEYPV
jgi:hypothetical protein